MIVNFTEGNLSKFYISDLPVSSLSLHIFRFAWNYGTSCNWIQVVTKIWLSWCLYS